MTTQFSEFEKQVIKDIAELVNDTYNSTSWIHDVWKKDGAEQIGVMLYIDKEHYETIMNLTEKLQ